MSMQAVSKYLNQILTPQLEKYGVLAEYIEYICQIVEEQMLSAILHWQDISFRKALLLIGSEEGPFYEPEGKVEIKCFVVITLRNSPFESLQSKDYVKCGLSERLTNNQIKAVTSAAILYFNKLDFTALSRETQTGEYDGSDIYGELSKCCPVTWKALISLASSPAKIVNFTKTEVKELFSLENVSCNARERSKEIKAALDGYSSEIDPNLTQQLEYVGYNQSALAVDCFR